MIDVVDLTYEMIAYYGDAVGVPEYINMPRDSHKKSQQEQLAIHNVTRVDIAKESILQPQAFNTEMKE